MPARILLRYGCLLIPLAVASCSATRAPVSTRDIPPERTADIVGGSIPAQALAARSPGEAPEYYAVARGDTLYSIAWRYGLDYRTVARWNGLRDPYVIYAGSRLRLRPARPEPAYEQPQRGIAPPVAAARVPPSPAQVPTATRPSAVIPPPDNTDRSSVDTAVRWAWPARGQIVPDNTLLGRKGVNIRGKLGQAVFAAAPGHVVYSGSGLIGYGKLIIVKHNDVYLSAYANNSALLVGEGDRVTGGQQIAEMGSSGQNQVMLHFEIRRNGKPVDPLQYLPKLQ